MCSFHLESVDVIGQKIDM